MLEESVIQSNSNEKVKLMRALQTRKGRKQQNRMLIEGNKLLDEAVAAGYQAKMIFVQEDADDLYEQYIDFPEVYKVSRSVIESVCDVETPQKIVAAVEYQDQSVPMSFDGQSFLALDQVQDPGNLGAILRCADAFGISGVFIGPGCADVFSPKCLRSAMGSTFHMQLVFPDSLADALKDAQKQGLFVLATDLKGEEEMKMNSTQKTIVVVGNEGNGISQEVLALADQRYRLPLAGRAESLNVAVCAGILLYELSQTLD